MDPRLAGEVSITDLFDQFIEASTMRNVLSIYHRILNYADLNPCEFNVFFPKLKCAVMTNKTPKNWKAKALFSKIDKRAAYKCYSNARAPTPSGTRQSDIRTGSSNLSQEDLSKQLDQNYFNNNALRSYNCLVIGSGPSGLRTAIELQLLGSSRVVIVEKRSRFSRNNVLHLWPFVIDDLKSLGAKKFYGKFCAGSIDHISIRQLQLILLKVCLMIGCDFRDSCSYLYLCPSSLKLTKPILNGNDSDNKTDLNCSNNSCLESVTTKCCLESNLSVSRLSFAEVSSSLIVANANGQLDSVESEPATKLNDFQENLEATEKTTPLHAISQRSDHRREENLRGVRAHFQSDYSSQVAELHGTLWDVIIGADGRRNTLNKFFPRKEFRGRLAIAVTANFINRQTPAEASVSEISGLSFIYNQDMFNALAHDTSIQLENICYYKDDTHYFVMTAKKRSLLDRGVLIRDYATTQDLLSESNVDRQALLKYAKDAAYWTTGLEPLDFALNHYGQEDCAMFDFTSMYAASNACKALRTADGGLALVGLVGDSLLEPFWPTGSGCARGFLSSFDAAWMCRQWAYHKCAVIDPFNVIPSKSSSRNNSSIANDSSNAVAATNDRMALSVMAERESIYRILAQTTSENLQQNYSQWTLNPHTRYPNLNRHLITPSQVEHLMSNKDPISSVERIRRTKSPSFVKARNSPKKLRSANASPLVQRKSLKTRHKLSGKNSYKSRSRPEMAFDDSYLEFEKSYDFLVDDDRGSSQCIRYHTEEPEDLLIPSMSGTHPSSKNLLSLEMRRARDIDDCLRQRRQRAQLHILKDQLLDQFRSCSEDVSKGGSNAKGRPHIPGGAALFNELKRLREQQMNGKENKLKDLNGPLSLLNSMRRCASFAERVKSFESKLGPSSQDSNPTTPKVSVDNVKNLPQFATLQELIVNKSTSKNRCESERKSKVLVMKLSKDDWNVKCWEDRLVKLHHKESKSMSGSTRSLNKSLSVDSQKPEKQVELFKGRIKEMADKLEQAKGVKHRQSSEKFVSHSNSWVKHLKRELVRSSDATRRSVENSKSVDNFTLPKRTIKKLFADDPDEDADGLDMNKHYDHLCINRPTNKYLSRNGGYTSHLRRSKFDSSNVIDITPSPASRKAFMNSLTSRGSSVSSTISERSAVHSSSSGGLGQRQPSVVRCLRCKETLETENGITIDGHNLHRTCLSCSDCGITLRTNEIRDYLHLSNSQSESKCEFVCAMCKPAYGEGRQTTISDKKAQDMPQDPEVGDISARTRLSREEFLNKSINYKELYKNIIDDNISADNEVAQRIERLASHSSDSQRSERNSSSSEIRDSSQDNLQTIHGSSITLQVSVDERNISPFELRLPLKIDNDNRQADDTASNYRIEVTGSEIIDGVEQVTLEMPFEPCAPDSVPIHKERADIDSCQREMIDEDEINRLMCLDTSTSVRASPLLGLKHDDSKSSSSQGEDETSETSEDSKSTEKPSKNKQVSERVSVAATAAAAAAADLSDEPSSLGSPPNTEDYDSESDDDDRSSTNADLLTSEELGQLSDVERDMGGEEGASRDLRAVESSSKRNFSAEN